MKPRCDASVGDDGFVEELGRVLWRAKIVGQTPTLWIVHSGTTGDYVMRFRKRDGALFPQYSPSPRYLVFR